jgi:uncharacterized protein (TIGR03083 family)
MTERADRTIAALRSGYERVADLVRALPDEDLARPSGASGWDVSQVLSHLGSGAEIGLAALDATIAGSPAPTGDFNKQVWARWDAMAATERAAGFLTANEALLARWDSLDADARRTLRFDLGFLPAPVDLATATGMRLSEFAYHAWDVEAAFDPKAQLAPEAVELLLDQVDMFFGFITKPDALASRPVSVAVHVSEPERSFGLAIGEHVELLPDAPTAADAVLSTPAEWWLRLTVGRHAPQHTPEDVALAGDAVTLDDLRRVFPGY